MSQAQEVMSKLKNTGAETIAEAKPKEVKEEVKPPVEKVEEKPIEEKKEVVAEVKTEVKEEKKEEKKEEVKAEAKPINWDETEIPDEILERLAQKKGYKTKPDVEETQEEKDARIRRDNGEFVSWAISEGKLKAEDLALPKTLQDSDDKTLVYQDFANLQKAKNKNVTQAQIDRLFNREYPLNAELSEDATAAEIVAFNEDKQDAQDKFNNRALKLRQKLVAPIQNAKQQFDQVKKNQQIIMKADKEFNTFAEQFGKDFIYKSEDGDIPIELATDFRKNFLTNLQSITRNQMLSNPNGNLDVHKLANDLLLIANRKQIDGVLKSRYLGEGEAKGLKNFKNPITETTEAGAEVVDKKKEADTKNLQTLDSIGKLGNR